MLPTRVATDKKHSNPKRSSDKGDRSRRRELGLGYAILVTSEIVVALGTLAWLIQYCSGQT